MYILQSEKSGRFYVGHAEDLDRRLLEHNSGRVRSTQSKGPWRRVYQESFEDRSQAYRREMEIKSWKSSERIRALMATELERPEDREGR